ncbi:hypothetical protein GCM10020219_074220 [Nonomuraea dietziae]
MIGQSRTSPAMVRAGGTAMDSTTSSSTRSRPSASETSLLIIGTSMTRAFQSEGCSGAISSFHERTPSKRERSAAKPGVWSSGVDTSGTKVLVETTSTLRPPSPKRPASIAAARDIAPKSVEA